MGRFDWAKLLTEWNAQTLECRAIVQDLPDDVVRSRWLGYPPATEEDIGRAEARLGTRLPPSYREFLTTTNGWRATGFLMRSLWSTEEVEWYRMRHQDLIDGWLRGAQAGGGLPPVPDEAYFVYGEAQRTGSFRGHYLQTALQVSEPWDGNVYLLNPEVVTSEGEWEAWFFAGWPDAIQRHRSFWDLMEAEYRSFLDMRTDRGK